MSRPRLAACRLRRRAGVSLLRSLLECYRYAVTVLYRSTRTVQYHDSYPLAFVHARANTTSRGTLTDGQVLLHAKVLLESWAGPLPLLRSCDDERGGGHRAQWRCGDACPETLDELETQAKRVCSGVRQQMDNLKAARQDVVAERKSAQAAASAEREQLAEEKRAMEGAHAGRENIDSSMEPGTRQSVSRAKVKMCPPTSSFTLAD